MADPGNEEAGIATWLRQCRYPLLVGVGVGNRRGESGVGGRVCLSWENNEKLEMCPKDKDANA